MHHHSREYRHSRRDEQREWEAARRGAFKRGFGPFGPGFGGRGGRGGGMFGIGKMLADGDLRVVVLALLEDGPRHGYDIIKAVEERSHGFYSPSPGVVYPTLTYLEEVGYASAASDGNKKIYTITAAGRQHLAENRELADSVLVGHRQVRPQARPDARLVGDPQHRQRARPRHPRRHRRGQRGPPRPEGGHRRGTGGRRRDGPAAGRQGAPQRRRSRSARPARTTARSSTFSHGRHTHRRNPGGGHPHEFGSARSDA